MVDWPVEDIPDEDKLYFRVHDAHRKRGTHEISVGAFVNRGGKGMSTDWAKYSTPERTRDGASKDPQRNAVVEFIVGEVRALPEQTVEHAPDVARNNRAHTEVSGPKSEEIRVKLGRLAKWTNVRWP
jgi:hypothetical protein